MMGERGMSDERGSAEETELDEGTGTPVASEICHSIIWMSHLIERYANARLPTFGLGVELSMPRARLLLAVAAGVARETSTRMSDIALDVGVTARTITTMVDALERDGLVERLPDPLDRRAISLRLTENGEALVPQVHAALDEICRAVASPLSGADQATLVDLLTRLIERDAG
jgi:DNA-binding MarR family transcriptional regulator